MNDKGIVRNRTKIEAARTNARAVLDLREHGGLDALIWPHEPEETLVPRIVSEVPTSTPASRALAADLRSRGFRFVGPTTAYALMEAIGMVDTHLTGCHRRGSSGQYPWPAAAQGTRATVVGLSECSALDREGPLRKAPRLLRRRGDGHSGWLPPLHGVPTGGVRRLEGRPGGEEARLGGTEVFRCMMLRENRYIPG